MNEHEIDEFLSIQTTGIYEEMDWDNVNYNRTESTSYRVLESLMTQNVFSKNDVLVDFGCGRGRILFFTHFFASIPVIGVELNSTVFQQLVENKTNYLWAHPSDLPIELVNQRAEDFQIPPNGTLFYFFNPFSIIIFRKVIQRIMESLKTHPRKATVVIYYPLYAYLNFMENSTFFEPDQYFEVAVDNGPKDRVLIYRYYPEKSVE